MLASESTTKLPQSKEREEGQSRRRLQPFSVNLMKLMTTKKISFRQKHRFENHIKAETYGNLGILSQR